MEKIPARKTPIMGWASWNCFRTNISEAKLKEQFDALVSTELASCGYVFANTDDGFFGGRDENGRLLFHKDRFPNGIKPLADHAHALGLKAGIYSEAGAASCGYYYDNEGDNGKNAGLFGHEKEDLERFLVEYGFDFLKVDWCGALREGVNEKAEYLLIGKILDEIRARTGKPIVYNICRKFFPGEWAVPIADSWRTAADIRPEFSSILKQIDNIKPLRRFTAPGHVNDLDMMQIGNGLTHEEERSHFAMWCMMSTPLMIGCDLTRIPEETLEILKNKELIALDQDPACLQAFVTREYRGRAGVLLGEMWVKDLGRENSSEKAVALLNRSDSPLSMTLDLSAAGLEGEVLSIRDLWTGIDVPIDERTFLVPPHGTAVFRIKAERAGTALDLNAAYAYVEPAPLAETPWEEAIALLKKGAMLLDARTREEFAAGHIAGAVNTPCTEIYSHIWEYVPTKDTPVVVYCTHGLRSRQVKYTMDHMGYTSVFLAPKTREEEFAAFSEKIAGLR